MKKYIYKCDSCSHKWKDYKPAACPKCNKEDFILVSEVKSYKNLLIVFFVLVFVGFGVFFLFKNSVNKDAYFEKGIEYMEQEKYQLAVDNFTKSSLLNPGDPEPFFERAQAFSYLEKSEEAIADYTEIIEIFKIWDEGKENVLENVNLSEVYFLRGNFYADLEKYEEAIADYTKSINIDPDHKNIDGSKQNYYLTRGDLYFALKKYKEAILDYTRVLETGIKNHMFNACLNRANSYTALKKYKEAIIDYSRALDLDELAYNTVMENSDLNFCSHYKRACKLDLEEEKKIACNWFKDQCSYLADKKKEEEEKKLEKRKEEQKKIEKKFLNTQTAGFTFNTKDSNYKKLRDWLYGKNWDGKSIYQLYELSKYNLKTKKGEVLHLKYIKKLYIKTSVYEKIMSDIDEYNNRGSRSL